MDIGDVMGWNPTPLEEERRRRINVAVWAYAYEVRDYSIVSDGVFDKTCLEIDVTIPTGHDLLDTFFIECFSPSTGMWVGEHPEFDKLVVKYESLKKYAEEKLGEEWFDTPDYERPGEWSKPKR